ncbi:MAG: hypothetical protein AAGB24_12050 [Bacteroidota bacterium]
MSNPLNHKAQSKKVVADAEAHQNGKLVNTRLTPQERAAWEYNTAVGVAGQLKSLNLPAIH